MIVPHQAVHAPLFEPYTTPVNSMRGWNGGEIIHLGAEAEVSTGKWYGRDAIQKIRKPRGWRHPDLDKQLTNRRMTNEIKLTIWLSNNDAPVPAIWDVDLEEGKIIMEQIDGKPLIQILNEKQHDDITLKNVGKSIRILHRNAINHGDLSTNNIIITPQNNAYLIDLGLASRDYELEGYGVDLHVLHEIFRASHPSVENAMELVLEGYVSLDNEFVHKLLVLVAVPISSFALIKGYNYHKSSSFLPFGILGLISLISAVVFGESILGEFGEKGLTLLGSVLVAYSHFKNYKMCIKLDCSCHDN